MKQLGASLLLALAFVHLSNSASAQAGYHIDKERGYKIKAPADWECIPIDPSEKWIVAKFLSDRSFVSKTGDFPIDHRPMMRVIVFADSAKEREKIALDDDDGVIMRLFGQSPYKDYPDFLRQTRSGFYFSKEDRGKVGKLEYDDLEVIFDKDASKYRLVTWVFRAKDADFAVEFEILDDYFDKLAPVARRALKSFRFIKREGTLAGGTTDSGVKKLDDKDRALMGNRDKWKALPPNERKDLRKAAEDRAVQRYLDELPDDWDVIETENCLVMSHADDRYTAEVVKAVNCCRNWLDETFGDLSDDYVMKSIVRVCKDAAEWRAYGMGGGGSITLSRSTDIKEVVIYKNMDGFMGSNFGNIFNSMGEQYLRDKDQLIAWNLPTWFRMGFSSALGNAKPKGRKLEFETDIYTMREVKIAQAKKEIFSAYAIMTEDSPDFGGKYMVYSGQTSCFMRYILEGARGCKPLKDFPVRYLRCVLAAAEELDARETPESRPAEELVTPETEEEEEAAYKRRRQASTGRDDELIKLVMQKLAWSEKDWSQVEKGLDRAMD